MRYACVYIHLITIFDSSSSMTEQNVEFVVQFFFAGGRSYLWPHGPIKWRDSYALFEMNMNLTFLFLYVKYNSCVTVWPLFGQWCSYPMWNVYSTCHSRSSSLTDGFGISFSFFYEKKHNITWLLLLFSSPSWISSVSHRLILYAILHCISHC